jgi:hypothetical protein
MVGGVEVIEIDIDGPVDKCSTTIYCTQQTVMKVEE